MNWWVNFTGTVTAEVWCRATTGECARWSFNATASRESGDVAITDGAPFEQRAPSGPIVGAAT